MTDMPQSLIKAVTGNYSVCHDDDGRSFPHVSWMCPECEDWHDTDIDPNDTSPLDLPCEMREEDILFRVSWAALEEAEQPGA